MPAIGGGGGRRRSTRRRTYSPTVAAYPTPTRRATPVRRVYSPPAPAYPTPRRAAPSRAGPPTPPPRKLRRIRARNQEVRVAEAIARAYRAEGRRQRTVKGPPTPSYATRLYNLERITRDIERRSRARGGQVESFGERTIGSLSERARFAAMTPNQQREYHRARLREIGEANAASQAAVLGAATRPIRAVGEAIGKKARGPAVWTLEQLGRSGSAAAGLQSEILKQAKQGKLFRAGGGVNPEGWAEIAKATAKGATYKKRYDYTRDVLGEGLGWKPKGTAGKVAREIAGFTGGVLSDPLTFATGGTTTAARQGAQIVSRRVFEKAAAANRKSMTQALEKEIGRRAATPNPLTGRELKLRRQEIERTAKATARRHAARAYRRHIERAPAHEHRRGLTVRIAPTHGVRGKPVAPLVRSTAALGAGLRQVARPITKTKAAGRLAKGTRRTLSETFASVRPVGVSRREFELVKAIQREARGAGERDVRRIVTRANAVLGRLGEGEQREIIDAIEADDIARLKGTARRKSISKLEAARAPLAFKTRRDPDRLYKVALQIQSDIRYLNRRGRRSGLIGGQVGKRSRTREEVRLGGRSPLTEVANVRAQHKRRIADLSQRHDAAQRRYFNYAETTGPGPDAKRTRLRKEVTALAAELSDAKARAGQEISEARAAYQAFKRLSPKAQRKAQQAPARALYRERMGREARGYFPRVGEEELAGREMLKELEEQGLRRPPAAVGGRAPKVKAGKRREYRKPRAALRAGSEQEQRIARLLSEDVRGQLSGYGGQIGRGAAAREMNVALAQAFGKRLPAGMTRGKLAELEAAGQQVFRQRRGELEPIGAERFGQIRRASIPQAEFARRVQRAQDLRRQADELEARAQTVSAKEGKKLLSQAAALRRTAKTTQPKGTKVAGQYTVIPRRIEALARKKGELALAEEGIVGKFDTVQRHWKGLALATTGYLVRNLLGDTFNAAVHENPFRLARNLARGQKALVALHKQEKALRKFEKALPEDKRTIKLTDEQADAVQRAMVSNPRLATGPPKTTVSAMQVALLAEKMGVIRQGRFLELMEEGRKVPRPRGGHAWTDAVKHVEDSVRISTFLGGLQRGLDPRDAATRASKIHFDYGDLSTVEKSVFRRLLPFYTFTARNIPLQAKSVVTRPGLYAAAQRAREQGRQGTGLPVGYEEELNPYEARQLGVPIKFGDSTYTISAASPFTDLNDITALGGALARGDVVKAADVGLQRGLDMASVFAKLPLELKSNFSYFYRDDIQHEGEPFTRAPKWAIELGKRDKGFAKRVGLVPDYLPPDGKKTWGWGRKADYFFRQAQPGPISGVVDALKLGVPGANARNMSRWQRMLSDWGGVRATTYDQEANQINRLYDQRDEVEAAMERLRRRAHPETGTRISAENTTAEYERLRGRMSKIETELARRRNKGEPKAPGSAPTSGRLPVVTTTGRTTTRQPLPVLP